MRVKARVEMSKRHHRGQLGQLQLHRHLFDEMCRHQCHRPFVPHHLFSVLLLLHRFHPGSNRRRRVALAATRMRRREVSRALCHRRRLVDRLPFLLHQLNQTQLWTFLGTNQWRKRKSWISPLQPTIPSLLQCTLLPKLPSLVLRRLKTRRLVKKQEAPSVPWIPSPFPSRNSKTLLHVSRRIKMSTDSTRTKYLWSHAK